MQRNRLFDRNPPLPGRKSPRHRTPRAFGLRTLGGACALGLACLPGAAAADITISDEQTATQTIGGGQSLEITGSGSIVVPGDGVVPTAAGASIGNIDNNGIIDVGVDGIRIDGGAASGNITNGKTITAGSVGIKVSGASVTGSITNGAGGLIDTAAKGGADAIAVMSGGEVSGDIVNAGTLSAGYDGIYLNHAEIGGQIINRGTIDATDDDLGAGIDVSSASSALGGITNEGEISGSFASVLVWTNAVSGAITNAGTLNGALRIQGKDGSGGGIDLTNSGTIALGTGESIISGDYVQQGVGALAITLRSFGAYPGAPLSIAGDAAITGDLVLTLDPGFIFSPFSRFTLIAVGGGLNGAFANYADDALVMTFDTYRRMYIDYTGAGNIQLYTTPAPGTLALLGLGLGLCGWRLMRRPAGI